MKPGRSIMPLRERKPLNFKRILGGFLTGLAFLAPLLLTMIVLAWVLNQLIGIVGPDALLGRLLTAIGEIFTGRRANPALAFAIGVTLLIAGITALGFLIRDRARKVLEDAVDSTIGSIPLLGSVYRPVAQLVRGMSSSKTDQMASMGVARVCFGGGVETVAFLASPETFDLGGGPCKLVLIPTAPVPIGGALLLIPVAQVQTIPDMKFEDLAKLYLTMGMHAPDAMKAPPVVPEVFEPPHHESGADRS
jgi:uncharacterized membrane protein